MLPSEPSIEVILEQVKGIRRDVARLETDLKNGNEKIETEMRTNLVTNDRFRPVQLIAFGLVSMLVTAVLGAMISLVVKGAP